jgi:hypothetical protein
VVVVVVVDGHEDADGKSHGKSGRQEETETKRMSAALRGAVNDGAAGGLTLREVMHSGAIEAEGFGDFADSLSRSIGFRIVGGVFA